jgi:hypothetical protein
VSVGEVDTLNPAGLDNTIWSVAEQVDRGVDIVSEAETRLKTGKRAYDLAYATAYLNAAGAAHEKKFRAERATQAQREAWDVADVAFEHAKRRARALEVRLSAFQTISKSIVSMFGAAGHQGRGQ